MKTIVGLFERYEDADSAIGELQRRGIGRDQISVLAHETSINERLDVTPVNSSDVTTDGMNAGATGGAIAGGITGLLWGLSAVAIPGIGPFFVAGALWTTFASTVAGAGLGAVGGGMLGALLSWGLPEEHAHAYAEGVRRGGFLIAARVPDESASAAQNAMTEANAVDIEAYRERLLQSSWEHFDEARQLDKTQV